jgi:hypothetical protein
MGIGWDWLWWECETLCWSLSSVGQNPFVFGGTMSYVGQKSLHGQNYLIWDIALINLIYHIVNRMLITWESSVGAFLHLTLLQMYLCYYILHIIISSTCWVPTISALNLAIFPLPHKPATQKLKKILSTSAAILSRVIDLVFCKTLFVW